jgi:hypothetical protein
MDDFLTGQLPHHAVPWTPELQERTNKAIKEMGQLNMGVMPLLLFEEKLENPGQEPVQKIWKPNSFNRNFWNLVACVLCPSRASDTTFGAGKLNQKDITGAIKTSSGWNTNRYSWMYSSGSFGAGACGAATGDDSFGILVGSGSTSEDFNGYALASKISHGTSAGKLSYGAVTVDSNLAVWDDTAKTFTNTIRRIFNNNSGSAITVNETALYCYGTVTGTTSYVMEERNLLPTPSVIENGGQYTAIYTFVLKFPQ